MFKFKFLIFHYLIRYSYILICLINGCPFLEEYNTVYEPDDQMEWGLVLAEIKAFIEADTVANVLDSDSNSIVLSHRLNPLITPPVERSPIMTLSLQEVIIVGNVTDQVKFSELTLDMFRMLETLEREPQDELTQVGVM